MAEQRPPNSDLSDMVSALSVDDCHSTEYGLDQRKKLREIETNYESVFSWEIKRLIGDNENLMTNILQKVTEKYELHTINTGPYDLNR